MKMHVHCGLIIGNGNEWIRIDGGGRGKNASQPIPVFVRLGGKPKEDPKKYPVIETVVISKRMRVFKRSCSSIIKCLIHAFETIPQAPYDYYSTNSNTYIHAIMRTCGLQWDDNFSEVTGPEGARSWIIPPTVYGDLGTFDIYAEPTNPINPKPAIAK